MNVLFLTLADYNSINVHGLYSDLLRQFLNNGDDVYMVSAFENDSQEERTIEEPHTRIVKVPIMTMQKTNIVKKGLSMLTVDKAFKKGIKKHLADIKFDLVLYPTPPITLLESIKYVKNRYGAMTYLLLKDIFPQNAVDIGLLSKSGVRGAVFSFFRYKEKQLYKISDYIGCMSKANVDYVTSHNSFLDGRKVEVCHNSVDIVDKSVDDATRKSIRAKYGIPLERKVFIFGGNLGKPQGVSFMIKCMETVKDIEEAFFLIVGDGTEYGKIESFLSETKQLNVKLMKRLPREEYDTMVGACDIGLIFLDHRFTIPNYPSRLISYMQAKIPVLAVTDPNTDIGKDIVEGGFGWWCESDDADGFLALIRHIIQVDSREMGQTGFDYLKNHFSVQQSYETIMRRYRERIEG